MDSSEERRKRIEAAAFSVLAQKGYRSASMLQIAKRAKVSNETLYALYGNKQGLFRSIIESNKQVVRGLLEESLQRDDDALRALEHLGSILLCFTMDAKAAVMNRAAVADAFETGMLAQAIDQIARGVIHPLICQLMERLGQTGQFELDVDAQDAADSYVALLFGELQFRQALGTHAALDAAAIEQRAKRAFTLVCRLYER